MCNICVECIYIFGKLDCMITLCYKGLALPALYCLIGRWGLPDERRRMTFMVHVGTTIGGAKAYLTGTNVLRSLGEFKPHNVVKCWECAMYIFDYIHFHHHQHDNGYGSHYLQITITHFAPHPTLLSSLLAFVFSVFHYVL